MDTEDVVTAEPPKEIDPKSRNSFSFFLSLLLSFCFVFITSFSFTNPI